MKVSLIQVQNNEKDTKNERINRISNMISSISETDMIILPELWNVGFFSFGKYKSSAEKLDGKFITDMSALAKEKKCFIFTGSFVEEKDGEAFNTAALLDRNGNISAVYRKTHLFGDEKKYLTAGNKTVIAETEFGKIGFGICYDLRFPEHFRQMLDAKIFIVPSAWPYSRKEHLEILTRARAIENQAFLFSCCMCGNDNGNDYSGGSMIISPKGDILSKASLSECCNTINIDLSAADKYREDFPALKDRIL